MKYTAPLLAIALTAAVQLALAEPWPRHVIDDTSRGADGARLADVNGDGLLDICTGWEEGGLIRVYLHPGPDKCRQPWPAVTVGEVASPEDAVFVDLDGDGAVDVVSCCEGRERTVYFHWAPSDSAERLDPRSWKTEAVPATAGKAMWMFALPMQVDGQHGVDLIVGAKGPQASVGWLRSPRDPRRLEDWIYHPLRPAGWIMSLVARDMDGDGDLDLVVSDRKGPRRGVFWLENPGPAAATAWKEHPIGGQGVEVMFLDVADLDGDGLDDVLAATFEGRILYLRRTSATPDAWQTHEIPNPHGLTSGKSVRAADIDGDGRLDLVHSSDAGGERRPGRVSWLSYENSPLDGPWRTHDISDMRGVKFDLLQLVDLDGDGDLDVLTCEERDNLGVLWYENPHVRQRP